jgi:carbon monoxide dehydrogenase subunit G
MQLKNQFTVPLAPRDAWVFLMNIQEIAPCFPGVELTEFIDENTQKGRIKVKLGPVSMVFAGTLHFKMKDEENLCADVSANWREEKGRGSAQSDIKFQLLACDHGTQVQIESDVQLAGQVAQYGRGVGMISEISEQLISQFARNLEQKSKDFKSFTSPLSVAPSDGGVASHSTARIETQGSNEISAFSLLWKVLMARWKSLFKRS